MKEVTIITVVGARPQFVKAAAVSRAIAAHNAAGGRAAIQEKIVHTGQHYDRNLSGVFFEELKIPQPAINLEVGSGSHGRQTAEILRQIEPVLLEHRPDWVLIYGDTNSTLAGALAAAKLGLPIAHVEAGLRSFNRAMPEEINRILADRVSTLLLCPTPTAVRNLAAEGVTEGVHNVGDVMYDSVLFNLQLAQSSSRALERLGLTPKTFCLATLHRAENTDHPERLGAILSALGALPWPVLLPLHPRTVKVLAAAGIEPGKNIRAIEPAPYLDMLMLTAAARLVLTDSGGLQKEAFWLGTPCLTLRDETEWVELVQTGCNRLVGADPAAIAAAVKDFESAACRLPADRPADLYGDGHAAEKVVGILTRISSQ